MGNWLQGNCITKKPTPMCEDLWKSNLGVPAQFVGSSTKVSGHFQYLLAIYSTRQSSPVRPVNSLISSVFWASLPAPGEGAFYFGEVVVHTGTVLVRSLIFYLLGHSRTLLLVSISLTCLQFLKSRSHILLRNLAFCSPWRSPVPIMADFSKQPRLGKFLLPGSDEKHSPYCLCPQLSDRHSLTYENQACPLLLVQYVCTVPPNFLEVKWRR